MSETKKLWKNIEPHLKKALQTLYLREVSSSQWERYQQELEDSEDVALHGKLISIIRTFLTELPCSTLLAQGGLRFFKITGKTCGKICIHLYLGYT